MPPIEGLIKDGDGFRPLTGEEVAQLATLSKKEELETGTLEDVEIFRSGVWNGDVYTERDLEDIVKSFNEINSRVQAFFKLDHPEKNIGGMPSIGWIKDLRKVGTKLMATITDVPVRVVELIKKKAYKRISSEIYWNYRDPTTNRKYRRVLKAAALLGAVTPAVDSLEDVEALYKQKAFVYSDGQGEVHFYRTFEEGSMDYEKLYNEEKAKREKLEGEVKELEKTLNEKDEAIKKLETEKKTVDEEKGELEKELEKKEEEKTEAEVKAFVKKQVEARKITPKMGKRIVPLMKELASNGGVHTYEVDGEKKEEPMLKIFESVIEAIPGDGTPVGEDSGRNGPDPDPKTYEKTEDGEPQERGKIAARAAAIAKEKDIDIGHATELALEEEE